MPIPAVAANICSATLTVMERLICTDSSIAARDAAMTQLYRAERLDRRAASLRVQRQWLAGALTCRDAPCLKERYDMRNAAFLQQDGGRRLAHRYHLAKGNRNGDLLIFRQKRWITYDAIETVIGPGGEAAGNVSAARLQGTARLLGAIARETKPDGCEATLQHNRDGSWSMATRHRFEQDRADLNDRFLRA